MNIYYLVEGELSLENQSSVVKKVVRQSKVWIEEGNEVLVFSLQSGLYLDVNKNEIFKFGYAYRKRSSALSKLMLIWFNSLKIFNFLKSSPPDVVYSRLLLYTPFIEFIARKWPTIIEVNSYEKREYAGSAYSTFTRIYTRYLGDRFKKLAQGFVFVTNELSDLYVKDLGVTPEFKTIGNSYDFSSTRVLQHSCAVRPQLLFLISPGLPWHGLDKLRVIASNLPEFDFHVVGEKGESTDNLTFHGYLSGEELERFLSEADIGIASLALERVGLKEACPLKSREYLSYGLPCFGGYLDTDFIDSSNLPLPIYKSLSSVDDIDKSVDEIRGFVTAWMNSKPYKDEVKYLASSLLDDRVKEEVRLDFFNQIVTRNQ